MALKSKQLLTHSMVGRLRAMVALSSMDMFSAEELEDELVISASQGQEEEAPEPLLGLLLLEDPVHSPPLPACRPLRLTRHP